MAKLGFAAPPEINTIPKKGFPIFGGCSIGKITHKKQLYMFHSQIIQGLFLAAAQFAAAGSGFLGVSGSGLVWVMTGWGKGTKDLQWDWQRLVCLGNSEQYLGNIVQNTSSCFSKAVPKVSMTWHMFKELASWRPIGATAIWVCLKI